MNERKESQIKKSLARVANKQRDSLEKFQRLLAQGRATTAELEKAQKEQAKFAAEQARLMAELRIVQIEVPTRPGSYGAVAGQRPMREQVLEMLNEIGVPSAPRTISELAAACCAITLPTARFASLRRDEFAAYEKNPGARPAWVVPAINVFGLTTIPRIVANSAWEPELRLVGSRTMRVNHLRTLLALLRSREHLLGTNEQRAILMEGLIARFASSVPGALDRSGPLDFERIAETANSELARIEPLDSAERQKAANRLRELPTRDQLWGRAPLTLVEGMAGRSA